MPYKPKRYFVTSIVPGAEIHKGFAASIETFCKKTDSELLLVPTRYTVDETDEFPEEIRDSKNFVQAELKLNSKIRISDFITDPTAVDPAAGISRQAQKDGAFIFGGTKQRLKIIPNPSHEKLPHAIMTPGALTKAFYRDNKRGKIAFGDHVIGGLVVEIENDDLYHFRQVQADDNGHFIDLSVEYTPKGTHKVQAAGFIPGDYHCGDQDPMVKSSILEMIELFKPENTIWHDFCNGKSVNRHEQDRKVSRASLGEWGSLSYELEYCYKELAQLSQHSAKNNKKAKTFVVRSNHDIWIDTYLEDARYIDDKENYEIGHILALEKLKGKNPFESGVRRFDSARKLKNVTFLKEESDLILTPKRIQCGAHGHKGANGARGTSRSMEAAFHNSVGGHTHTPEILRGGYTVGTSTFLNLPYNAGGASSWLNTMCVVYPNGSRQLINVIFGKWRAQNGAGSKNKQQSKRLGRAK